MTKARIVFGETEQPNRKILLINNVASGEVNKNTTGWQFQIVGQQCSKLSFKTLSQVKENLEALLKLKQ